MDSGFGHKAPGLDMVLTMPGAAVRTIIAFAHSYLVYEGDGGNLFDNRHAATLPRPNSALILHGALQMHRIAAAASSPSPSAPEPESVQHFLIIKNSDENDEDIHRYLLAIARRYRQDTGSSQYKVEAHTVSLCTHVAAVLWYLGYKRHDEEKKRTIDFGGYIADATPSHWSESGLVVYEIIIKKQESYGKIKLADLYSLASIERLDIKPLQLLLSSASRRSPMTVADDLARRGSCGFDLSDQSIRSCGFACVKVEQFFAYDYWSLLSSTFKGRLNLTLIWYRNPEKNRDRDEERERDLIAKKWVPPR
ncbi:hypothetical protein EVAR_20659_1 [Eumeta japonica]|uniref:Uncharacterized protein n=1 Tax=Eumeta variegata TaxID=151549 RepID=A0A4C1VAX5_EUMVA|nr:hypothetical protein EVAR_20659_1 [Eumeta japonica]